MARTDIGRLIEYLTEHSGKATLVQVETEFGWNAEKVYRLVDSSRGKLQRHNMGVNPGIVQMAVETGARDQVPVYQSVSRVLHTTWARSQRWRAAVSIDTAQNGSARTGQWSRPDCVVVWFPGRRTDPSEPARLSTFEIEVPGHFAIQSVYQAHAQGHGAYMSWVIFHRPDDWPEDSPHQDWNRICWAAKFCGIGLVSYTNPGNFGTWNTHLKAAPRKDGTGSRDEFLQRAVPEARRGLASLGPEELLKLSK